MTLCTPCCSPSELTLFSGGVSVILSQIFEWVLECIMTYTSTGIQVMTVVEAQDVAMETSGGVSCIRSG